MTLHDMATIALAILWGGALCGLGRLTFIVVTSENRDQGRARFMVVLFAGVLLATLAAADVFNVIDWVGDASAYRVGHNGAKPVSLEDYLQR